MTHNEIMDQLGEFTGKAIEYKYTQISAAELDAMGPMQREMVEMMLYCKEHGYYDSKTASKKQAMPSGLSSFKAYLERVRPTL
ncbi:hypothetical protein RI367_005410 [Sorochytrium milnesiophthora]